MTGPQATALPATDSVVERLLALLPVHIRARDEESGGLLRALLTAVASELDVLERDVSELYDSWFVETCPEWAVPYLADLVGLAEPLPDLGAAASRRAVVANTVAYRRRKGTVAVLERLAGDVTGWPAHAVESYRLLASSAHMRHMHLERPATAGLRPAAQLDLEHVEVAGGSLTRLPHSGEVRPAARAGRRFRIPDVGVFLFPLQVLEVGAAGVSTAEEHAQLPGWPVARRVGDAWRVHPLGRPTPLFAVPRDEGAVEHLAAEEDLPIPLRPRRLLANLEAARAASVAGRAGPWPLPVAVSIDGAPPLPPGRIRVSGLEDLLDDVAAGAPPQPQVLLDVRTGALRTFAGREPSNPDRVLVRHAIGSVADVGAGTYDRTDVHERALQADPYAGDRLVSGQTAVIAAAVGSGKVVATLGEALQQAGDDWAAGARGTYVISIGDNGAYPGDLRLTVPEGARLVLVAASWPEQVLGGEETLPPRPGVYTPASLRPLLSGTLTLDGGAGSSVVLDGLVLDGDLEVADGQLGSLTVAQCTVSGTIRVVDPPVDTQGPTHATLQVAVLRSMVGGVQVGRSVPRLDLQDSIVDGAAVTGAAVHLVADGATVRAPVAVRSVAASSCIFDGGLTAEYRQTGCLRYCYLAPGSRTPRRYRCVPGDEGRADPPRPVYVSTDPGSPPYLALAGGCPPEIAAGGEGGAEMGVHHHLRRPLRAEAARRLAAPYVPVGLEAGLRITMGGS